MAKDLEAPKPFVPSGFTDENKLDAGGVEQMRFGLAGSGPLAKAVLDSNAVATRVQLGLGATPIAGIISMYGGTVLPAGYLWCDGLAHDKAVYPGLFAALGVNRYDVDTATQFFVPNLTSHLPRGAATTGGAVTTNNNNTHGHGNNATTTTATTVGNPNITVTNNDNATSLAHNHNVNAGSVSSVGAHNHNNNGTTTTGGSNNNVAAGNTSLRPNSGHQHTVGGGSTSSTGDHLHNNNSVFTSSDGGTLVHSHANTATATQGAVTMGTITTGTVIDNTTYVPAFVEVNYIIKT